MNDTTPNQADDWVRKQFINSLYGQGGQASIIDQTLASLIPANMFAISPSDDAMVIGLSAPGRMNRDVTVTSEEDVVTIKAAATSKYDSSSLAGDACGMDCDLEVQIELDDYWVLNQAGYEDGIVTIHFSREVPPEKRLCQIPVAGAALAIEHEEQFSS